MAVETSSPLAATAEGTAAAAGSSSRVAAAAATTVASSSVATSSSSSSSAAAVDIPPLAHAVGGCLGGALALFLLFPLERVKIEMQSMAAHRTKGSGRSGHHHRHQRGGSATTVAVPRTATTDGTPMTAATQKQQGTKTTTTTTAPRTIWEELEAASSSSSSSSSSNSWTTAGQDEAVVSAENGDESSGISNTEDPWQEFLDAMSASNSLSSEEDGQTLESQQQQQQQQQSAGMSRQAQAKVPGGRQQDADNVVGDDDEEEEEEDDSQDLHDLATCFGRLWERGELYRGMSPIITTLTTTQFVFFYLNECMKRLIVPSSAAGAAAAAAAAAGGTTGSRSAAATTPLWSLLASSVAGVVNVLITNPLWVANLRIVTGEAPAGTSLVREIRNVAANEGIQNLWTGSWTSILLVSNPVIQFFLYQQLKDAALARYRRSGARAAAATGALSAAALTTLPAGQAFVLGAVAKAIATVLTYPLQLTQAVLRLQRRPLSSSPNMSPPSQVQYRGTWDCLVQLYTRDGFPGWYAGMKAKLLQTVLTAAFTFLTYEQILRAVTLVHGTLVSPLARKKKKIL